MSESLVGRVAIKSKILKPGEGMAVSLSAGQLLQISTPTGKQVADFVAVSASDPTEVLVDRRDPLAELDDHDPEGDEDLFRIFVSPFSNWSRTRLVATTCCSLHAIRNGTKKGSGSRITRVVESRSLTHSKRTD